MINDVSHQVTSALFCQLYEAQIDIKSKLNGKVISKKGNDLSWYNTNSKMHDTMHNVNEIIQHYFNNLERRQLCTEKEKKTDDSADNDERSYRYYHSDSKDSIDIENNDIYDFNYNSFLTIFRLLQIYRLKKSSTVIPLR